MGYGLNYGGVSPDFDRIDPVCYNKEVQPPGCALPADPE